MKNLILLLITGFLFSCSSSKLKQTYLASEKPPVINKILVVGITSHKEGRIAFETKLQEEFKKKQILAVPSLYFFEPCFTEEEQSQDQLLQLEKELKKYGFDAVLLSKVLSKEEKTTLYQAFENYERFFYDFKNDYLNNQNIYFDPTEETYFIYHTETSLYYLSDLAERELVWRATIDIKDPSSLRKTIDNLVNTLISALEKDEIIALAKRS